MTSAPKLADMEPVLAQVASWDNSQAHDPLYEFSNFLQAAIASNAELPQIEGRLLRMLAPQLDKATIIQRLKDTMQSALASDSLKERAKNNWYILFGEELPQ